MTKPTTSYADAGVNIEAGNELVSRIKNLTKKTQRKEVLGGIGGFGALFELPLDRYKQPILVSSTDGVGTKLKLAQMMNNHETIGIDLVAMCVNDIIVSGAEPVFFLDYFATGKLSPDLAEQVIAGIAEGCYQAGCALVGGETAEMPGLYQGEDYDLAGFTVGIVDKNLLITGKNAKPGNTLIALASSGPHSNGYSLIRKIIEDNQIDLQTGFTNGKSIGETLLTPTRIYVKSILHLLKTHPICAMAHITGGGITENLPRVLPDYTKAIINLDSFARPEIFSWLQKIGGVETVEMLKTFNVGVGMILCVDNLIAEEALAILSAQGETAWIIGHLETSDELQPFVEYQGNW